MNLDKPRVTVVTSRQPRQARRDDFAVNEKDLPQHLSQALTDYHYSAWEVYQKLPFPNKTDEPWRRTEISKLPFNKFIKDKNEAFTAPDPLLVESRNTQEYAGQVVLTGDQVYTSISEELEQNGIIFTDFRTAELLHADLLADLLGKIVKAEDGKFAALASAFGQDGIFLYVPKGVRIEQPLHSLFWGAPAFSTQFSHILVWLEANSEITLVHEFASDPLDAAESAFHCGMVELHVDQGAKLNFVEMQSWGEDVWSITHEKAKVGRDGKLEWVYGAVGTRFTKNFSDIDLDAPGAQARMAGFYFTDGQQHFDLDTQQNHFAENTNSDLLFKGVLFGQSRAVWQGMIYVAPGADKSDGYQSNKNLILSKTARADSIPGLEILANDVRCSHGATVSNIDETELFYLQSRGIPPKEAEKLVVKGFFSAILERIPVNEIRDRVAQKIDMKLDNKLS